MALTPAQYQTLKTELLTDPRGYGYAPLRTSGSDNALADLLNLVRDGTNTGPAIPIRRVDVLSKELWEAIDVGDMTALPGSPTAAQLSTERRQLAWLTGLPAIPRIRLLNDDGSNTPAVTNLLAIFPVSGTRTRITALASRNGSRAEELFGRDTRITDTDVAIALRNT